MIVSNLLALQFRRGYIKAYQLKDKSEDFMLSSLLEVRLMKRQEKSTGRFKIRGGLTWGIEGYAKIRKSSPGMKSLLQRISYPEEVEYFECAEVQNINYIPKENR